MPDTTGWVLFDWIYYLITNYFLPPEHPLVENWGIWVAVLAGIITVFIFYVCIIRPFFIWIKYGMFGGGKRGKLNSLFKED